MKEKIEVWNYYKGYKKIYIESRELLKKISRLKDVTLSSKYYKIGKVSPVGWDLILPTPLFVSKVKRLGTIVYI